MALDTRALVREASRLAPLPRATTQLVAILAREDWKASEVLDVVRLDPILTGKVVGAANSALATGHTRILELADAIRRVGPRTVVGLALAAGTRNLLSQPLPSFALEEGELWRHSLAALLAAEIASARVGLSAPAVGITASFLHDVGKVLMARFLDPETHDFLQLARLERGQTWREAEAAALATTHGELGALVALHWGLPEEIAAAIQHHHDLEGAPAALRRSAALVQVADSVARDVAPPRAGREDDPEELALALEILSISGAGYVGLVTAVADRLQRIEELHAR